MKDKRLTITDDTRMTLHGQERLLKYLSPQHPGGLECWHPEGEVDAEIAVMRGYGYTIEDQRRDHSAPNTLAILHVPLAAIEEHPQNPRRTFDAEKLDELAGDIRERGILQPLVVRSMAGGPDDPPLYQLIAGARRYRAARIAGLATVPVIVRDDMSDSDVLAAMMSENIQRSDLNAIERARGLAALRDAGLTQAEIGRRLSLAQPTISNALRLLDLPETVQQMALEGKLDGSAAQELLALARWPAACERVAAHAVKDRMGSREIRAKMPFSDALKSAGLARELSSWAVGFDWKATCEGCEDLKHTGAIGLCLRPECCEAKEQEHKALTERRRAEAQEAVRRQAEARLAGETGAAAEVPAPRSEDMGGAHRWLGAHNTPAGCRLQECEHYALLTCRDDGRLTPACTNIECMDRLLKAQRAAEQEASRQEATARLMAARGALQTEETLTLIAAWAACRAAEPLDLGEAFRELGIDWNPRLLDDRFGEAITLPSEQLLLLAVLPVDTLRLLPALICLFRDARTHGVQPRNNLTTWLLGDGSGDLSPIARMHAYRQGGLARVNKLREPFGLPALPDPAEGGEE